MTNIKQQNQGGIKRKLFHPVVVTAVLLVLLVFGNSFGSIGVTGAQDDSSDASAPIPVPAGDTQQQVDAQVANACVTALTAYADPEFDKYKTFMEDNFKNKSSTSSLLDLGIQRYDQFKTDISGKFQELIGQQLNVAVAAGSDVSDQGVGLNRCNALALQYVSDANKLLSMRAITTSDIKKASIFVEKYKQINDKLRAMNLDVMKMVVDISAFQQKLPCYLKSCA